MTREEFMFELLKGLNRSHIDDMVEHGYLQFHEEEMKSGFTVYNVLKEFEFEGKCYAIGEQIGD